MRRLAELSMTDIQALDRARTVVIIPAGLFEEHGPYDDPGRSTRSFITWGPWHLASLGFPRCVKVSSTLLSQRLLRVAPLAGFNQLSHVARVLRQRSHLRDGGFRAGAPGLGHDRQPRKASI
jgi:hypothetical protein